MARAKTPPSCQIVAHGPLATADGLQGRRNRRYRLRISPQVTSRWDLGGWVWAKSPDLTNLASWQAFRHVTAGVSFSRG